MIENYFFIDGSALVSQIKTLQKAKKEFAGKKLNPIKFIFNFLDTIGDLNLDEFKRAVFYFPTDDKEPEVYINIPDIKKPGLVRDISFKYCGEKLKHSQSFNSFLETVPKRWIDRCTKSEKGIDIEICCDAFKLAFNGKMERLFILTNDRDFIPLCRTLKDLGVNVSLIHLSKHTNINKPLVKECDTYDLVDEESLPNLFDFEDQITTVEPIPKPQITTNTQ